MNQWDLVIKILTTNGLETIRVLIFQEKIKIMVNTLITIGFGKII
jgi:hypothetical protein